MKGKSYIGFTRNKDNVFIEQYRKHNIEREEKKLGPTCVSKFCQKSSKRNCHLFSEETRKKNFNKFWGTLNWTNEKCTFVHMLKEK